MGYWNHQASNLRIAFIEKENASRDAAKPQEWFRDRMVNTLGYFQAFS